MLSHILDYRYYSLHKHLCTLASETVYFTYHVSVALLATPSPEANLLKMN